MPSPSRSLLSALLLVLGSTLTIDAEARTPKPDSRRESEAEPRAHLIRWLRAQAPKGVEITAREREADEEVVAVYEAEEGDSLASIARALLPLSETYLWTDFAAELVKANPPLKSGVKPGMKVKIPNLVRQPHALGAEGRLNPGGNGDGIKGVYVRGTTAAGHGYVRLLDKLAEHGMNAIVLDSKDTDGVMTYASKVPLAIETGATKDAPITDLPRTIRFAHDRGIRVVMRVSCFHDEWMQHHKGKEMSIRGKWGGIYPIGWLDPANEMAHEYLIDLAKEAMDAGADEIELDYVRYPVIGIKNADFKLDKIGKTKPEVIRDFVREMHAVTHARHVPLSLDIFGVVAQGKRVDIDGLGQDVALLGPECEVLSPMVYPSHYAAGYLGFEIPGNHPELVGIGTKGTVAQLNGAASAAGTLVRPWVQAVSYESPDYGPGYLRAELKSAVDNGSSGWLMWNPSQDYATAWAAAPKVAAKRDPELARNDRPSR
jgi:hypothetical protein